MGKRSEQILEQAKGFLEEEISGIREVQSQLDESFVEVVDLIRGISGKVVVTGIGKSGHVGRKIAGTLSSTGTPALFLHPAEGVHGDLGVITKDDVVLAITKSGYTEEILSILPTVQRVGCPIIAMTGNPQSELAKIADLHLSFEVSHEACPLRLAPTTSTTASLALGDALALCLLQLKQFTPEKFALFHPQGSLGKKLLTRVQDLMIPYKDIAKVSKDTNLRDGIVELAEKRLGLLVITSQGQKLEGVFSGGDLGRYMRLVGTQDEVSLEASMGSVMSTSALSIRSTELAAKALKVMEEHSVLTLVVTTATDKVEGVIQLYDILREGLV